MEMFLQHGKFPDEINAQDPDFIESLVARLEAEDRDSSKAKKK